MELTFDESDVPVLLLAFHGLPPVKTARNRHTAGTSSFRLPETRASFIGRANIPFHFWLLAAMAT